MALKREEAGANNGWRNEGCRLPRLGVRQQDLSFVVVARRQEDRYNTLMLGPIPEHISEDRLEAYVMRTLSSIDTEQIDEHLLICESCRVHLQDSEEFVLAMRAAARRLREA